MRVYGDRPRRRDPRSLIAGLEAAVAALPAGGIERHGALVDAFIAASELGQGLADAEFAIRGCDARSPLQDAAGAVVMVLADAVVRSWLSGFAAEPVTLPGFDGLPLPDRVEVRPGEGYAFYALYPEAYAMAAARLPAPRKAIRAIGVRSIGLGLAAMVAAALFAATPITVRPVSHPFRRELRLAAPLREELAGSKDAFAVVDEGPGLSGSTFASVTRTLEGLGVEPERITLFPSHQGAPGAEADPAWATQWTGLKRASVTFDALVLNSLDPAHRLETWVAELTGEAAGPMSDISGGSWRGAGPWPPVNSHQERRKFLLRSATGPWLLKFAGLGGDSGAKLARALALAEAGFTPEVAGLRHGFLVERWIEGTRPPDSLDRPALLARLGDYIGFRVRAFPADPEAGADLAALLEMARINTAEGLGEAAAKPFERWRERLPALEARTRRIDTDNRMHAWEWLVTPDGRLLKTDAVDHAHAHDLVGAQDAAWDVAGAVAEFDLDGAETAQLLEAVGRAGGHPVDAELLALVTPCYLAFQLGAWTLAAGAHGHWPEERARLEGAADRYARRLERTLSTQTPALA